jgi:glycosyltransferase involved in cell wall biosynthesis
MERARLVLTANYETAERVKGIRKSDPVITLSEVGVHSVGEKNAEGGKLRATDSLKLLWSGQLIPRKNFGLLMEALSRLPDEIRWHLRVAGEGNLLEYWKTKSVEHGLREHLTFLGQVAYSQMSEQYRWADVFAFPSLREATGTVILEAMSYGLPVIALKLHGARVVLDDSCGILVPVVSKEQMVKDFRDAIIKLYYDPELRRKLGEAGRKRVEESHLWEKKAQRMSEIYRQVLTQGN